MNEGENQGRVDMTARVVRAEAIRNGSRVTLALELDVDAERLKSALPMIEMALNMNRNMMSAEALTRTEDFLTHLKVAINGDAA